MAIFRCTKCGHIQEAGNAQAGQHVRCPACQQAGPVYPTVPFVKNLIQRYMLQRKQVQELEGRIQALSAQLEAQAAVADEQEDVSGSIRATDRLADNIFHTRTLAEPAFHAPVSAWFAARQVNTVVDTGAVDTTGLFDDIAVMLGDHFAALSEVLEKIRYCQRKHYADVKLVLTERSQKEIGLLTRFCALLYQAAFVTRYVYQKKERVIRLGVQQTPVVTAFFNGGWLEWYVLMKLLLWCQQQNRQFACTRNLKLVLSNEDQHELDVFFLLDGKIPVCIECKSGEFRQDIDKYLRLCKRMGLDRRAFILCATTLDAGQAEHLSSMHGLSFTTPEQLLPCLEGLLQSASRY